MQPRFQSQVARVALLAEAEAEADDRAGFAGHAEYDAVTLSNEHLAGVDAKASRHEICRAAEIESPSAGTARL